MGFPISADISAEEADRVARDLANPVLQKGIVGETKEGGFDWLVAVGFLPGVTDNVGRSAHEAVSDIVGRHLRDDEFVFSSVEYMIKGDEQSKKDIVHIANDLLANELIQMKSVYICFNTINIHTVVLLKQCSVNIILPIDQIL